MHRENRRTRGTRSRAQISPAALPCTHRSEAKHVTSCHTREYTSVVKTGSERADVWRSGVSLGFLVQTTNREFSALSPLQIFLENLQNTLAIKCVRRMRYLEAVNAQNVPRLRVSRKPVQRPCEQDALELAVLIIQTRVHNADHHHIV